jgi:hypothetical protein
MKSAARHVRQAAGLSGIFGGERGKTEIMEQTEGAKFFYPLFSVCSVISVFSVLSLLFDLTL